MPVDDLQPRNASVVPDVPRYQRQAGVQRMGRDQQVHLTDPLSRRYQFVLDRGERLRG